MKTVALLVTVLTVLSTYQIYKYSRGYHKLLVAHEVNTEALVAQDVQISFLQEMILDLRKKNTDMLKQVELSYRLTDMVYMSGCMDSGKSEGFCLKKKNKNKGGVQ